MTCALEDLRAAREAGIEIEYLNTVDQTSAIPEQDFRGRPRASEPIATQGRLHVRLL